VFDFQFHTCTPLDRRISKILLVLAMITIASGALYAQEPSEAQKRLDREAAAKDTRDFIAAIRPKLFGNLSGRELEIYNQIEFRVTNLEATWKAASSIDDGQRIVESDEGVARQMEILAAAIVIEQIQNRDVLIPYIRYVAMAMNRQAGYIKDVTTFAHFDPDRLDRNKALHTQQIAMVLNGMAFLLAHEVGHHVLGHYEKRGSSDRSTQRQMELDADAWAIRRCIDASPHFSPMGGLLPLLFAYYTTPHPIAQETSSNHPAEVRRILAMFEAMRISLPDFRDDITKAGSSYSEFRDFVNSMISRYSNELDNDSTPVESLSSVKSKNQSETSDSTEEDDAKTTKRRRIRLGGYCGDVQGDRYCPMFQPMPLGSSCTCSNLAGWGVVVR